MAHTIDLALTVLDRQLIDNQGRRCGRVDDVQLDAAPSEEARVAYLLVGRQVRLQRLPRPLNRLANLTRSGQTIRVPWEAVEAVTHVVKLRCSSRELGLGKGDERAARWLGGLPGAR